MQNTNEQHTRTPRSARRTGFISVAVVIAIAAGLFAWNRWMTPVGYELVVENGTLFAGAPDTARICAQAVNKAGSAVPFLRVPLRGEVIDGRTLGRLETGEEELLFISTGTEEGLVRLRVMAGDWPFPLLAEVRIVYPVAMRFPSTKSETRSTT